MVHFRTKNWTFFHSQGQKWRVFFFDLLNLGWQLHWHRLKRGSPSLFKYISSTNTNMEKDINLSAIYALDCSERCQNATLSGEICLNQSLDTRGLFFKATLQVFTLHSTLYSVCKISRNCFFARLFCSGTLQISNTKKNRNTSAEWKLGSEDLQSSFKKQAPAWHRPYFFQARWRETRWPHFGWKLTPETSAVGSSFPRLPLDGAGRLKPYFYISANGTGHLIY